MGCRVSGRRWGAPTPGSGRVALPHRAATETVRPEPGWLGRQFPPVLRVAARIRTVVSKGHGGLALCCRHRPSRCCHVPYRRKPQPKRSTCWTPSFRGCGVRKGNLPGTESERREILSLGHSPVCKAQRFKLNRLLTRRFEVRILFGEPTKSLSATSSVSNFGSSEKFVG
jgi:hypothetical protein